MKFGVFQYPRTYETFYRDVHTPNLRSSTIAARYELTRKFDSDGPLKFSLGAGFNPYFTQLDFPETGNNFPVIQKILGASLNVVPRLSYNISKRFSAELNIPFKLYDFQFFRYNVRDPGLSLRQQTRDEVKSIFFQNAYTIRLGVIYTFERKIEESSANAKKRTGYNDKLKKKRKVNRRR
jgi:hypothetical protein